MRDLRGKVAVVTGAGSGIGAATARVLAGVGMQVHLVDIHQERVESVRAEIGGEAMAHVVDCTDAAAMERLSSEVYDRRGRVHLLQNGVGALVGAPVEELTLDDWRRAIDVNIWSVVQGIHAFVPRMLAQGERSHLVNVASVAGLVGFPYTSAYSTTKFAVVGLSEALSAELYGRGICVTAVCPGMVTSELIVPYSFST